MNDEIMPMMHLQLPFGLDDKIFHHRNEEGEIIGEPHSYNDYLEGIKAISGINEELLGAADD